MIKSYLKVNYPSLINIKAKIVSLRDDIMVFCRHLIGNSFLLEKQLKAKNKLHFGSGSDNKPSFINIDINRRADIFLDVRNRLNIPNDSIEYIYSSHFVEHLEHKDLVAHLKECYRVLEIGGVLRLGVPDFPKVFNYYCTGDEDFLEGRRGMLSEKLRLPPEMICLMDCINKSVHEFGEHKICLDMEKIRNLLIFAGFSPSAIEASEFDSKIDLVSRKEFTFFVEARKLK